MCGASKLADLALSTSCYGCFGIAGQLFIARRPPGPTGTLTGTLQAVGGPSGVGPRALSGQITLHGPSGHITGITVAANGRFSAPVPVGKYTVSGQSPQYQGGTAVCHASAPVTVTKGVTSSVAVDCQES